MKKYLYLALAAMMLGFTACGDDEVVDPQPTPTPAPTPTPTPNPDSDDEQLPEFFANEAMDVREGRATIKGYVSNTEQVTEMGIIYGANPTPSEENAIIQSVDISNDFTVTLTGLYEATTYHYCAYVYVNGKYHKSKIKSFTTKPYSYTRSGKIWGTVLVNGGGMKAFRMMQTELTNYLVNSNQDVAVTKAEFRKFLTDLREETGLKFRLPTSEEWKFAAIGGSKSRRYTYAGSNILDEVAWYSGNAGGQIHAVGEKKPNELGLYDMCGNYAELCNNNSSDEFFIDGEAYGGSYKSSAANCTPTSYIVGSTTGLVSGSSSIREQNAYNAAQISFRLVYDVDDPRLGDGTGGSPNMSGMPDNPDNSQTGEVVVQTHDATDIEWAKATVSGVLSGLNYNVDVGILYHTEKNKLLTEGKKESMRSDGSFTILLDSLCDETTYYYCAFAIDNNKRYTGEIKEFQTRKYTYEVNGETFGLVKVETDGSLQPFSIMQTEVPPSEMDYDNDGAITTVEMRTYVVNLRKETGLLFRIPSSEEWMFAAAGGLKSHNYKYSGSNNLSEVAWYSGNSNNTSHALATKKCNELGLYDMSGNFGEICWDGEITMNINTDAGPIYGGSYKDIMDNCTITSHKATILSGYVPNTDIKEKNATDASCNTIRLVYSR